MSYSAKGVPSIYGKHGSINLKTGVVTGKNPLKGYGDVVKRAEQFKRLATFTNNGDLTLISTIYKDGPIAAFEEQVGSHGGVGGEQTDSFVLHHKSWKINDTSNASDVFGYLNKRGNATALPESTYRMPSQTFQVKDAWSLGLVWKSFKTISTWLPLAARTIVLDKSVYKEVANKTIYLGPAIILSLVSVWITETAFEGLFNFPTVIARWFIWLLVVVIVFGGAKLLRGTGTFTQTLIVMGFAMSAHFIELVSFIFPQFATPLHTLAFIGVFFGTWYGVVIVHELKSWRTVLLPIAAIFVTIIAGASVKVLLSGVALTYQTLIQALGL